MQARLAKDASLAIALVFALALSCCACRGGGTPTAATTNATHRITTANETEIEASTPEAEGMSSDELIKLTEWIRDHPVPIFSLLISRNGHLVYELYTSSFERDDAHYLMSITKSVLSAAIGVAIDRHLLSGPEAPITETLPRSLFSSDSEYSRLQAITLKQVMGMSALDAPDPPRKTDEESSARYAHFWSAHNRLAVAVQQPTLKEPFQYNDTTPTLAVGALQYATRMSALDYAEQTLFRPMGFRNYEWMHQDPSGLDNGGYGLRLRPMDMQKFGLLYLHHGIWNGKQLLSNAWVSRTFEPWNKSDPTLERANYGWFWWTQYIAPGFTAHVANGWKGQRIAVIPEQNIVLTMTGCIEDGTEGELFTELIKKVVMPSVQKGQLGATTTTTTTTTTAGSPTDNSKRLREVIEQANRSPSRLGDWIQYRMVPSATPKQKHRPFVIQ